MRRVIADESTMREFDRISQNLKELAQQMKAFSGKSPEDILAGERGELYDSDFKYPQAFGYLTSTLNDFGYQLDRWVNELDIYVRPGIAEKEEPEE